MVFGIQCGGTRVKHLYQPKHYVANKSKLKGETNKNLENVLILRDVKTIQHKANYYLDFTSIIDYVQTHVYS